MTMKKIFGRRAAVAAAASTIPIWTGGSEMSSVTSPACATAAKNSRSVTNGRSRSSSTVNEVSNVA